MIALFVYTGKESGYNTVIAAFLEVRYEEKV